MRKPKKVVSHSLAAVATLGFLLEKLQDTLLPEEYNIKSGTLKGFHDVSHSIANIENIFSLNEMKKDRFYMDGVDPTLILRKTFANIFDSIIIGFPLWNSITKSLFGTPIWVPFYMQTTTFMRFGWDFLYIAKSFASRAREISEKYSALEAKKFMRIENILEKSRAGLKIATQAFDYLNYREILEWYKRRKERGEQPSEYTINEKLVIDKKSMYKDILMGEAKLFLEFAENVLDHWRRLYKEVGIKEGLNRIIKEYRKKEEIIYSYLNPKNN
ncbi:MAG: hypothetical protein QXX38_00640 [Candidatus Aenigmatarchaeota archaeon]